MRCYLRITGAAFSSDLHILLDGVFCLGQWVRERYWVLTVVFVLPGMYLFLLGLLFATFPAKPSNPPSRILERPYAEANVHDSSAMLLEHLPLFRIGTLALALSAMLAQTVNAQIVTAPKLPLPITRYPPPHQLRAGSEWGHFAQSRACSGVSRAKTLPGYEIGEGRRCRLRGGLCQAAQPWR